MRKENELKIRKTLRNKKRKSSGDDVNDDCNDKVDDDDEMELRFHVGEIGVQAVEVSTAAGVESSSIFCLFSAVGNASASPSSHERLREDCT